MIDRLVKIVGFYATKTDECATIMDLYNAEQIGDMQLKNIFVQIA